MGLLNAGCIIKTYYRLKPLIPRRLQILLRQRVALLKRRACTRIWPICETAGKPPDKWRGWPDGKRFALVLTHDVDTARGQERCARLREIEQNLGFRSSFNFVPKRYEVSRELRDCLVGSGFEVGVHGLYHDGKHYESRDTFTRRAVQINGYLKEWGAVGFRSPSMLHNLEWIGDLDIEYDASTFDTDPFEPQTDGVATIFPFLVRPAGRQNGYVELPYTLPQDFTLYVLLGEKNIDTWRRKLDWICERGGMALLNAHPDYMRFDGAKPGCDEYPAGYYTDFLAYIRQRYEGRFWHVLPREMARFWTTAFRAEGDAS
jgi:hypothetical protein